MTVNGIESIFDLVPLLSVTSRVMVWVPSVKSFTEKNNLFSLPRIPSLEETHSYLIINPSSSLTRELNSTTPTPEIKSSLCLGMLENFKSSIFPLNNSPPRGFWPTYTYDEEKSTSPSYCLCAESSPSSHIST